MAVRTAYAPVAASVLTAANLAKLPGGWIGDASATANQTLISTVTDLTGLSVTVTVGTGRRIKISAHVVTQGTSAATVAILNIQEGATVLSSELQTYNSASDDRAFNTWCTVTPTSGTHTYKLTLQVTSSTTAVLASATSPAQILVEDIGATP